MVGGGVGSNLSIAESKTFPKLEIDSSILTNSLFNFLILFLRWDPNFRAPSILSLMECLSDLRLSISLSEDLICLFNLFILFFHLFICLAVKGFDCLSFNISGCLGLSGLEGEGCGGGGGGGLVGLRGLVRGAGGVSKAINSAFLNLKYLPNPRSFARAFGSGTFSGMWYVLHFIYIKKERKEREKREKEREKREKRERKEEKKRERKTEKREKKDKKERKREKKRKKVKREKREKKERKREKEIRRKKKCYL